MIPSPPTTIMQKFNPRAAVILVTEAPITEQYEKLDELKAYVKENKLFIACHKDTGLETLLCRCSRKCSPHLLRHSRSTHLYQHGMDLTLLAQRLGHAQLKTTLIYAHADTEQKRKTIDSATPYGSPLRSKLNSKCFTITDDETLKKLYGLKG